MQDHEKHIFYTDDDEDDQDLFRGALADTDDSKVLTVADDGDTLMQLLTSPPPEPHLIFLDLNMPRKNGYEVLEALRASGNLRNYPVIVFSTTSDEAAIARTRQLGADLFITKPRTYNGIKAAIKACLAIDWQHFKATDENYVYRAG